MKYTKDNNIILFKNDKYNKLFINAKGNILFDEEGLKINSIDLLEQVKEYIDSIKYELGIDNYNIKYTVYSNNGFFRKLLTNGIKSITVDKYSLEKIIEHCNYSLLVCMEKYDIKTKTLTLRLSRIIGKFNEEIGDDNVKIIFNKFVHNNEINFGKKSLSKKQFFGQIYDILK
jgi:hypothetical protein